MTADIDRLSTEKIGRLMVEFSLPSIASLALTCIYNLIDAIFLGQMVGDMGIAATQVALPLSMLITTVVGLPGLGGIALVAIKLGANHRREAEVILANTATLTVILGTLCMVGGLLVLKPVLALSGATPELMPAAQSFMGVICLGSVFQGMFLNMNNFIRTAGDPRRALLYNGSGMIACIVLNFLFVVLLHWGVVGSALATVAGQFFSMVLILVYYRMDNAVLKFHHGDFRLVDHYVAQIMLLGVPMSVSQIMLSIVGFVLNTSFANYGATGLYGAEGALAIVGVLSRINFFSMFVLFGVSIGVQPLLGYNYGAQKIDRLKRVFWMAVIWTSCISLFVLLLLILFLRPVVSIFGISPALVPITARLLVIYTLPLPLSGFLVIAGSYFQSVGKPLRSTLLFLLQQGLCMLPLLFIFPLILPSLFPGLSGLEAIIWSTPAASIISFIIAAGLMRWEFGRGIGQD